MTKNREDKLWDAKFIKTIKKLVPGTPLREGLENILRAKMGVLVLVGNNQPLMDVVDGGFSLNCEYTPAGFYELGKMDGALILSSDLKHILYANAQLVPDSKIPTTETGTRHRTAERVARQTGGLVIAISQRRNLITMYLGNLRYTLKDITVSLSRANQALQTLEKYRKVLVRSLTNLSALEFEDFVTLLDVAEIVIRVEHVNRIAREVERHIIELGSEGRLVNMQMEELLSEQDDMELLLKDYCNGAQNFQQVREQLAALPEESLEPYTICRILGYGTTPNALDIPVVPRGYRVLSRIPRLPMSIVDNLVTHFRTLHCIYNATTTELDDVEGIGEVRAKTIKDGLKRVREQALLDRHV
ncbi:DNA integrity scanning diadenylate cyclase DisA [Pelosinus sp. IPA-1]|uniref:DNA integrity scanning diadenylate cyclase DisA n=1 Tax=Pelosinus sp. IPA-1 TaxID=3029569 RepID=UPI00243620B5|nr:DNA integrity scanning diadenylate cyclase DisA [Pelosinus sp. IPA-1]GMB02182.1 DNA integrity scanning protein DisA [Pelosinus sp. IPA-1]